MFCSQCGSPMNEDARFCPSCGAPAGHHEAEPASAESPIVEEAAIEPVKPATGNGGSSSSAGSASTAGAGSSRPAFVTPVQDDRNIVLTVLLTIFTCGIYNYYFCYCLARDLNTMCAGDGEETPGLLIFVLLSIVTCGFYSYYWYYKIGNRLQANAPRYGLAFQENGTTVLLWQIVGALLCCIGPIIAQSIVIQNTNAMAKVYNSRLG